MAGASLFLSPGAIQFGDIAKTSSSGLLGVADGATGGLTKDFRQWIGVDCDFQQDDGFYKAGYGFGFVGSVLTGTKGATTAAKAIIDGPIANARNLFDMLANLRATASTLPGAERLATKLAIEEGISGGGHAIAGAGTGREIDDIARLVATYGGEAADWAKMAANVGHQFASGIRGQVHWYENVVKGIVTEGKLKL